MANSITYDVNQSVGLGSVTGFIETNGTIGPITESSEIVDWNLTLFDGSSTADLQGPNQTNPNSSVTLVGSALSATATTLSFDFGSTNSELLFLLTDSDPILMCWTTNSCPTTGGGNGNGAWIEVTQFQWGVGRNPIGAVTPLPAALPLFATGLGTLGLLGWRRKRKARLSLLGAA
jgi:hypothetical protein